MKRWMMGVVAACVVSVGLAFPAASEAGPPIIVSVTTGGVAFYDMTEHKWWFHTYPSSYNQKAVISNHYQYEWKIKVLTKLYCQPADNYEWILEYTCDEVEFGPYTDTDKIVTWSTPWIGGVQVYHQTLGWVYNGNSKWNVDTTVTLYYYDDDEDEWVECDNENKVTNPPSLFVEGL